MEQSLDAMVESIANRVADIVWQRIEPQLKGGNKTLVTRQEVMDMLKVSDVTLWKWEREGRLVRSGSFGRRVYYDLDEVKQQLKSQ